MLSLTGGTLLPNSFYTPDSITYIRISFSMDFGWDVTNLHLIAMVNVHLILHGTAACHHLKMSILIFLITWTESHSSMGH